MSVTRRPGLVLLLLLGCSSPGAVAQIVFGPPIDAVPVVHHGYSGATADLDGDGFVDLVLATSPEHEARVYFGDGRGHFGPGTPTSPSIDASAIGLGDLDGDGHPELLTAPYIPGQLLELHVWTGLGGAAFSGPVSYAIAGDLPSASGNFTITASDVDGDTDLDVIIAAMSYVGGAVADGNSLSALLNDGAGGLTLQVIASNLFFAGSEVADLDANGTLDAAYSTVVVRPPGLIEATTRLMLGQPGGGFVEAQAWPHSVVIDLVDLDRDGLLDLVTTDDNVPSETGAVTVHLGQGGATFADQRPIPTPFSLAAALVDFDGDAVPDLLLQHTTFVIYPTWAVWPGDGRGGFDASKVSYANREGIDVREFMFAVDAVADGRLDIIDEGGQEFGLQVGTTPNWTYPAGSPQLDLGHALYGRDGWPGTRITGDFVPDEPVTLELWAAGENTPAFLVAGLTESLAPFKGGVMVPEPDLLVGPLSTGPRPHFELDSRWPHGLPAGSSITLQWWISDAVAPQGLSASTAVRITQP